MMDGDTTIMGDSGDLGGFEGDCNSESLPAGLMEGHFTGEAFDCGSVDEFGFGEFQQGGFGKFQNCEGFGSFMDSDMYGARVPPEFCMYGDDLFNNHIEPVGWGQRVALTRGRGRFPGGFHPHNHARPPTMVWRGRGFIRNEALFNRRGMPFRVPRFPVRLNSSGRGQKRKVTLPNGMVALGTGTNKKTAKHNAARGMLDIVEGRANHVSNEVSQSITDGLKALRGDDPSLSPGPKTFKPKLILNENQKRFIENQKKQQTELLKQQLQYGPLGVKLWFAGDGKDDDLKESTSQKEPNRGPPEPSGPTDDEKLLKIRKSDFYIKDPVHKESIEEYLTKLILRSVFAAISKRSAAIPHNPTDLDIDRLLKNTKSNPSSAPPETICKMCNLVFKDKVSCEEHKGTADHLHVVKGYFPGEGGYHCFLCWISFQQAEGLLNHISRANHQARSKKKGVVRIWMEPIVSSGKTWDLINVHKHIKDLNREGKSSGRRSKSRERRRGGSRSRERDRSRRDSNQNSRDGLGGSRHDQHDDRRLPHDRSSRRRTESPRKWRHDKYSEVGSASKRKSDKDHFKWKEVKEEGRSKPSSDRVRSSSNYRADTSSEHRRNSSSSSHLRANSEHLREMSNDQSIYNQQRERSRSHHSEQSGGNFQKEKSTTRHSRELISPVQYDVNLYGDHEASTSTLRHRSASGQRLSGSSSETLSGRKRSRRVTGSDHEEVNEIQDDFEIDSVGKIENSEETLQKMKSAIIGILDEEISSLSKKIKK